MRAWALAVGALGLASAGPVEEWNELMLQTIMANKIPSNPSSRMLAMLHVAQWNAVKDYLTLKRTVSLEAARKDASLDPHMHAAIASAGKTVFSAIAPSANASVSDLFAKHVTDREGLKLAVDTGAACAQMVLDARKDDGATPPKDKEFKGVNGVNETGMWRPTPPAFASGLAVHWKDLKPFAMTSPSQFRSGPQPSLTDKSYSTCYKEVLPMGNKTSDKRSSDQSDAAMFWSGNPEVMMSMAAQQVSVGMHVLDAAKLFAVLEVAGADARIASWDTKWTHMAWRPVTAIRLGNAQNWTSDPYWDSFIATPATPEWPSAHSATSEAMAVVLRNFTGSDKVSCSLTCPLLPGKTRGYLSFTQAVDEMGESRINGGVHYRHSVIEGKAQGNKVGNQALAVFGGPLAQPNSNRRLRA